MNRLQKLTSKTDYLVSLNSQGQVEEAQIIYQTNYTHPVYTPSSVASQERLRELNGRRHTYFCGAHLGYGFHEDGVASALEVAKHFGLTL